MDHEEGLDSPHWANNDELKALNEKLDRLIGILHNMQGRLVSIEMNTKPSPLKGRSGFAG